MFQNLLLKVDKEVVKIEENKIIIVLKKLLTSLSNL